MFRRSIRLLQNLQSTHPTCPPLVEQRQTVNPWSVQGAVGPDGKLQLIDYDRLVREFGTTRIDSSLVQRFEKATGHRAHPFLRRGLFFSHRDLDIILTRHESKKPFYLYTGRGPSSGSMHIGHMVPFLFSKWLQQVFNVPLVVQLTDDEKFLFNEMTLTIEQSNGFAIENAKDIISFGFDPENTFIFSNINHMGGEFYKNVVRISKSISCSAAKGTFGFNDSDSIGKLNFVAIQAAPSFSNSFPHLFGGKQDIPCLIPCAIDQDPYFRLTRQVAHRLKYPKPALILSSFFPALQGPGTKMSASNPNSAIYISDSPSQIKNKIKRLAFSGGGTTAQLHKEHGANLQVDVSYQYLKFFMEDDEEFARIEKAYGSGEMSTSEIKQICADVLTGLVSVVQQKRKTVTTETLQHFMKT